MEKSIISDTLIKEQAKSETDLIREAFREHFGLEITEIQDAQNFEYLRDAKTRISSYIYRGETFLYVWESEPKIDKDLDGNVRVEYLTRYRKA